MSNLCNVGVHTYYVFFFFFRFHVLLFKLSPGNPVYYSHKSIPNTQSDVIQFTQNYQSPVNPWSWAPGWLNLFI